MGKPKFWTPSRAEVCKRPQEKGFVTASALDGHHGRVYYELKV